MTDELKPCPFRLCSGHPDIRKGNPGGTQKYRALCDECHTGSPWCDTEQEAVGYWNMRDGESRLERERDEARRELAEARENESAFNVEITRIKAEVDRLNDLLAESKGGVVMFLISENAELRAKIEKGGA